jgi:ATP-dependent Clp protease ATP-binding subunit ClpB
VLSYPRCKPADNLLFSLPVDDEGGVLTEAVRRRPYQVVLLDEFEKAHPDVWNILLQTFDEGVLHDMSGRKVDFRNVIIVATSNLGAHVLAELPEHVESTAPEVQEAVMDVVRGTLSPELLNRIDELVVFNRLERSHMDRIAQINVNDIARRLETGQNMQLDISGTALHCLAEKGYDVRYGARPLKRTLTRELLNPLSRMILEGGVVDGDTVMIRSRGEAEKVAKETGSDLGWISSNDHSTDKNDVVVMRNHEPKDDDMPEDGQFLLDDEDQRHG